MMKKVRAMLPHVAILICNMYIVFYLIDRVNTAMNFIDNGLTKGLLLILCVVTPFNVWALLKEPRRRKSAKKKASGKPAGGKHARTAV